MDNTATAQNHFIPQLCSSQAVLLLVLVTELVVLALVLARSALPDFDWESLALSSLLAQWLALSSAALLCLGREWLNRLNFARAAAVSFTVVMVNIALFSAVGEKVLLYVRQVPWTTQDSWRVLNTVLIGAIISGIMLRYFYLQEQLRQQQQAELRSRLAALQARIRPHFLFNSMNSIASLIASDPERAEAVVVKFSQLFRAALNEDDHLIPLQQELSLCRDYLAIEQLRLGERLRLQWPEEVAADIKVPSLLLQPLLENAVYHGIQPLAEGGEITVEIQNGGDTIRIRVANPMPSTVKASAGSGQRMAHDNIRARLKSCYGNRARLLTRSNGHYEAELLLPRSSQKPPG